MNFFSLPKFLCNALFRRCVFAGMMTTCWVSISILADATSGQSKIDDEPKVPASASTKQESKQESQSDSPPKGELLFALQIKELFANKCNACHGDNPDEIEGEFNMLSRQSLAKGGDSFGEKVLIVGDGENSKLFQVTRRTEEGYEMPPKLAEKLTEQETWAIRDWINAGAPWPDDKRVAELRQKYAAGEIVKTSGGLADDWTNRRYQEKNLWAYRPLKFGEVPTGVNPIDHFVNRKLKQIQLRPAPMAGPVELIRRISFGMTGLPPTPKQISRFKLDFETDPNEAIENLVDLFLNSKHYGEHFGRNWLDVARYADTAGFANDYTRPNAWRYRDYVIRSFNEDKPYNQFVREQIAGDEIDPENGDNLIATGFLRMGPWEQTFMSVFRVTRQQWLDDVTDSVGQAFLAHPLQCCKCHDHKFDPLPTRDYYSMYAVFSTTQFADRDVAFLESENRSGFKEADKWTRAKIAAYAKQQKELREKMNKQRKQEKGNAKVGDNGLDPGDEASLARMGKNISRHSWELESTRPIAFSVMTGNTIANNNVSKRIMPLKNPWKKGVMEKDVILTGGDAFSFGSPVSPGPISAAVTLGKMSESNFPDGRGKRRLALANWIVDSKNPLTARVIVNRVWSWHFGKGIASNPNNFGATGGLPTHPELLDFLANWFVKNGGSIKKLNRLILNCETYRRASRHPRPEELNNKDPKRDYYATFLPRRLTAEELRDSMLAVSGELNRSVGGIPSRPEINFEVAMQPRQIMGGTASVYEPNSLPKQRNRRSIYAEKSRGLRDPFFETFNQPGPDKSCELRETSTVAPQALTMFNSSQVQTRALAFAKKLISYKSGDLQTVKTAFVEAIGRLPTEQESSACLTHWESATEIEKEKTYQPRKFSQWANRTVMAEKTGQPYDFVEFMPAFTNYVPDLQPHEVDAKTRGLAQVCLVIFNLNEFAYLD